MIKPRYLLHLSTVAIMLALLVQPSHADVTIKRYTLTDGLGGLLKASTTSTESYSGDMMANDSEMKMENKLVKMFGGGKPLRTTQITRLDKGIMWSVDHKSKKYTEMTFAEMQMMMDSAGAMLAGAMDPTAQQKPTIDTSEWVFSEPKFDVKRTGKKENVAGYDCEQAIMTMITEGRSREDDKTMTLEVTMDMMLAKNVPGTGEINEFGMKMAKAMGFKPEEGPSASMSKMMGMYGIDAEKLAEEARKLEGFAMKSVVTLSMGGDVMAEAQAEQDNAEQEQAQSENDESSEGSGGLAAKALGGLFGKKDKGKSEDGDKKKDGDGAPAGALVWMTTTVTGIESSPVSPTNFEVPEGYKLEKTAFQED